MFRLITLVQGLGLAYAAGLNLYAAVAITGLAVRFGWVHNVPTTIEPLRQSRRHLHRARALRDRVRRHARSPASRPRGKRCTA